MGSKLTITRGLPASGKSTWAESQRLADPDNVRVVTMDDIREAIGSSFEQGDEPIVRSIRDFTIRKYLEKGYHVISADTNLPERVVRHISDLAVFGDALTKDGDYTKIEIKDFRHVPLETCLERNAQRDRVVPEDVIRDMHDRFIQDTFKKS